MGYRHTRVYATYLCTYEITKETVWHAIRLTAQVSLWECHGVIFQSYAANLQSHAYNVKVRVQRLRPIIAHTSQSAELLIGANAEMVNKLHFAVV